MSDDLLKNKINKRLEKMDNKQLQSAYQIIKELSIQGEYENTKLNKSLLQEKINKGVNELDNKKGTDFKAFLDEMKLKYSSEK